MVTNCHIIAGLDKIDTLKHKKSDISNKLLVVFRNNLYQRINVSFDLIGKDGKPLYKTSINDKPRRLFDLAFLPILKNKIPKDAVIYPLDYNKIDTSFLIPLTANLITCGFRGDASFTYEKPIFDTIQFVPKPIRYFGSDYIFAKWKTQFFGNSGGPVYYDNHIEKKLVGVVCMEKPSNSKLIGFPLLNFNESLYIFISSKKIKKEISNVI